MVYKYINLSHFDFVFIDSVSKGKVDNEKKKERMDRLMPLQMKPLHTIVLLLMTRINPLLWKLLIQCLPNRSLAISFKRIFKNKLN
jgi:hypothetical protein